MARDGNWIRSGDSQACSPLEWLAAMLLWYGACTWGKIQALLGLQACDFADFRGVIPDSPQQDWHEIAGLKPFSGGAEREEEPTALCLTPVLSPPDHAGWETGTYIRTADTILGYCRTSLENNSLALPSLATHSSKEAQQFTTGRDSVSYFRFLFLCSLFIS